MARAGRLSRQLRWHQIAFEDHEIAGGRRGMRALLSCHFCWWHHLRLRPGLQLHLI